MKFSKFGQKFTQPTGISQLMDDLGDALKSDQPVNMLGGGNPAKIDAVNELFLETYKALGVDNDAGVPNSSAIISMANYSNPQGDAAFIDALVGFFNRHYDWNLTSENIALTNGSQNASPSFWQPKLCWCLHYLGPIFWDVRSVVPATSLFLLQNARILFMLMCAFMTKLPPPLPA